MVRPLRLSATSGVATVTPIGQPLPKPLALVMMSGRHAVMLNAEPFVAGAAPGGLHFVADEDAAVIPHDAGDDPEVFLGRRDESADALDRLGNEAGDAAGGRRCGSALPCPARSARRTTDTSARTGSDSSTRCARERCRAAARQPSARLTAR